MRMSCSVLACLNKLPLMDCTSILKQEQQNMKC